MLSKVLRHTSLYQIMISDTIKDRTVHIFRIHQFDMSLQAFFIADIPGMNDKSRLFILA